MKHADLIIAAAQGKKIQRQSIVDSTWYTYLDQGLAIRAMLESEHENYRLAPKPVVTWQRIELLENAQYPHARREMYTDKADVERDSRCVALLKLTHDPSTGEITAEVEKV